jgi:transcriptional regulator with XRE-family HTH domain
LSESKTLREWRELRGLTREELAEKVGVSANIIARLEEVGDPTYADTLEGDTFLNHVIGPIMEALDLKEGVALTEVPVGVRPGYVVLDIAALWELDEGAVRLLLERAEELDLRLAVPNGWDVGLKRHEDVTEADRRAITKYLAGEAAYAEAMGEYHGNIAALLAEHATDENQKTGDVLEERGGRWVPKRQKDEEEGL